METEHHLYNVCPRCGTMDDYGPLAEVGIGGRYLIDCYAGFHFTRSLCVSCWNEYNRLQTQMHYASEMLDELIASHLDGRGPVEDFRRGLLTAEEFVERINEYVSKIVHFELYGLPQFE